MDKSTIIDNLTTASTDKPLSANQGVILQDQITEINGKLCDYVLDVDINGDGTDGGDGNISSIPVEVDETLSISGVAADSKVTGDEIARLNEMIGGVPVSEQIAKAIVEVYVQEDEPEGAEVGSIWVDTDKTGLDSPEEVYNRNLYVIDAGTSDTSSIDFSGYIAGDIILITTS